MDQGKGNFTLNYSFSTGAANKPLKTALKDLLILDDVTISLVSHDAALVANPRTDKMLIVSSSMANLLLECDSFRTCEQHLQHIKKIFNLSELLVAELKKVITTMSDKGLMLSAETFKTNLLAKAVPLQIRSDRQWVLGIGSCDRPQLLRRLLDSALPYLRDYSPKPEFIFVDDSREQHNRLKNYQIVKSFCQELNIDAHCWDRKNRADFANKCARENPECAQSIQWLLNPEIHGDDAGSYGIGKNFIQLFTHQKPLIMLDDDCIISPMSKIDNKRNVCLRAEKDRFITFTAMNELLKTTSREEINPFQAHLEQLNRSVIDSILSSEKSLDDPDVWQELKRTDVFEFSYKDYVGLTTNCIAGAQHSRQMNIFFNYPKDVIHHEAFLESVLHQGNIKQISWRGPLSNNLNKYLPFVCSTMAGLAADDMPIPTIPIGRSEDLFLGEMKTYLQPGSQTYQFNWALPHLPDPQRTWNPQEAQTVVPVSTSLILRKILRDCAENCPYDRKIERLNYFAQHVERLVNGARSDVKKYVGDTAIDHLTYEIFKLENSLHSVKNHRLYLKGVRQLLESYKQELMRLLNTGSSVIIDEFLQFATPMGHAFRQWPKIVELARIFHLDGYQNN